jgi:hypothetical protein
MRHVYRVQVSKLAINSVLGRLRMRTIILNWILRERN